MLRNQLNTFRRQPGSSPSPAPSGRPLRLPDILFFIAIAAVLIVFSAPFPAMALGDGAGDEKAGLGKQGKLGKEALKKHKEDIGDGEFEFAVDPSGGDEDDDEFIDPDGC